MPHPDLPLPKDEIARICRRHHVTRLFLFGSAIRDDFRADSDLDFLAEFSDQGAGLFEQVRMQDELTELLGRPVDLLDRHSVESSENYIRRRHILAHLEPVYVAG